MFAHIFIINNMAAAAMVISEDSETLRMSSLRACSTRFSGGLSVCDLEASTVRAEILEGEIESEWVVSGPSWATIVVSPSGGATSEGVWAPSRQFIDSIHGFEFGRRHQLSFVTHFPTTTVAGTTICPIIHWSPVGDNKDYMGDENIIWHIAYTIASPGGIFPPERVVSKSVEFVGGDDRRYIKTEFPSITEVTTAEDLLLVRLYRQNSGPRKLSRGSTRDTFGGSAFMFALSFRILVI